MADIPVVEYTALQVKQAVVGHGKAAKEQVQEMVKRLLALTAAPASDAADALACAICHAHGERGPSARAIACAAAAWSASDAAVMAAQRLASCQRMR